eukprot:gene17437-23745_t
MTIPPSARLHIDYQGAISKRDDRGRVASATAGGSADSVSEVGQMAASLLSASSAMTNEEINVKLGELITRMDEMGTLLTTRMDEMDTKLTTRMDDLTLRMGKVELRGAKLVRDDVDVAMRDIREIFAEILRYYNFVMSNPEKRFSRMDVCTLSYMFCFMLEVVWTILIHASIDQRPVIFQKEPATKSSFVLQPVRNTKDAHFKLPEQLTSLPQNAKSAYATFMDKLIPYKGRQHSTIVYNKERSID